MPRERRTIPVVRDLSGVTRRCPLAPPEHASVYSRSLHRACLIVGGIDELAAQLNVPATAVHAWLLGKEVPPEPAFLQCVEIILLFASAGGNS